MRPVSENGAQCLRMGEQIVTVRECLYGNLVLELRSPTLDKTESVSRDAGVASVLKLTEECSV
jgi:hypothetical protein